MCYNKIIIIIIKETYMSHEQNIENFLLDQRFKKIQYRNQKLAFKKVYENDDVNIEVEIQNDNILKLRRQFDGDKDGVTLSQENLEKFLASARKLKHSLREQLRFTFDEFSHSFGYKVKKNGPNDILIDINKDFSIQSNYAPGVYVPKIDPNNVSTSLKDREQSIDNFIEAVTKKVNEIKEAQGEKPKIDKETKNNKDNDKVVTIEREISNSRVVNEDSSSLTTTSNEDDNFVKKYKLKYVAPLAIAIAAIATLVALQLTIELTLLSGIGVLAAAIVGSLLSYKGFEKMENNKPKNVT